MTKNQKGDMKMKRNIYKIGAAALLIGTIILSSISTQAIEQSTLDIKNGTPDNNSDVNPKPSLNKRYFIFGSGTCWRIDVVGNPNHFHSGRITGDLRIWNEASFCPEHPFRGYSLFVVDLATGKILSKGDLPEIVYVTNFNGFGYIDYYYSGMGIDYCDFTLRGFASNVPIDEQQNNYYNQQQTNPSQNQGIAPSVQVESSQQFSTCTTITKHISPVD